jgi:hypothetical protein
MTIETKTTIQLSDVTGIEFQCKNCGRIVSWPIQTAKTPPTECECNPTQGWMPYGGNTFASLVKLIDLIKLWSSATNEPFNLRFVVSDLSSSAKD